MPLLRITSSATSSPNDAISPEKCATKASLASRHALENSRPIRFRLKRIRSSAGFDMMYASVRPSITTLSIRLSPQLGDGIGESGVPAAISVFQVPQYLEHGLIARQHAVTVRSDRFVHGVDPFRLCSGILSIANPGARILEGFNNRICKNRDMWVDIVGHRRTAIRYIPHAVVGIVRHHGHQQRSEERRVGKE